MEYPQTSPRGLRGAAIVGLGLLLGAVRNVMDFPNAIWGADRIEGCLLFNESLCVTVLVAGSAWFLIQAASPAGREAFAAPHPPRAHLLGTGALVLGTVVLGIWNAGSALPFAVLAGGGALFAGGILLAGGQWLEVFASLEAAPALRCTAGAVALAGIFRFLQIGLDSSLSATICALTLILLSTAALSAALRFGRKYGAAQPPEAIAPSSPAPSENQRGRLAHLALLLWMPLAAAMLAGFIQGLVWNPGISETGALNSVSLRSVSIVAGPLAAAIIVLAAVGHSEGMTEVRRLQRVGLPLTMAILLLYPMVGPSEGTLAELGEIIPQAGFSLVLVLTWNALAIAARQFRSARPLAWAASSAILAATYLSGLLLISVVGTGGRDLCLVFLTAYLVLLSVSLAQDTQTERHGRIGDELRPDAFLHRRCAELTDEFGVSPRESEVLFYLGRGYNHTYIAQKLFISENTVRTHVRHIYGKLGVTSREELLDLIDGN